MKGTCSRPGFDRVATLYPLLENIAYAKRLKPGREHHLSALRDCRHVLLLGEGNGRFLARLLERNPQANATVVELSPRMIHCARQALGSAQSRVRWHAGSALDAPLPAHAFDAVVTHYFFDLFPPAQQWQILRNTLPALRTGGLWQDTEFITGGGNALASCRNRAQLTLSYRFLGLLCDFPARALHCPAPLFRQAGLALRDETVLCGQTAARLWQKTTEAPLPANPADHQR